MPVLLVTLGACLAYELFFKPQTYVSKVSISFPQAASPGLLGSLIGVSGGANNKYIGIVKSARLAKEVERQAGVQKALHFPTVSDAVVAIREGMSVDDNPRDGLMYITVQLPGPARFAPGASGQREVVRSTVAAAAAAYADALKRYLAVADVDKEAILLRVSEDRLRKERANYDRSVAKMLQFVKRAGRSGAGGDTGSDTESATAGATQGARSPQITVLEQLYARRAQLEADIRSASAAIEVGQEQRRDLVENLDSVPYEDPLLAQARNALRSQEVELESLRVQYGPDHPLVIAATKQVAILRSQFERQRKAALSGRSSLRADAEAKLSALQAALGTVLTNIGKAERDAHVASESQADYQVLHNNVLIALETLKATATNVAVLQLQTLSAKNRMTVVDEARPPRSGSPGLVMILAESLFATACVGGLLAAFDYSRYSRTMHSLPFAEPQVPV